ncbi:beta-alanyl-bioamine nonribosomal peptide synthetase ebony-like [Tubulanus polymorphus]|uniref:beta-alanyl-bioamine nonribosomal peptide synthetase ebony-like n=1 Tax=Tubulanus polymorphus TaxID=672921 RepID=UPI003DA61E6A
MLKGTARQWNGPSLVAEIFEDTCQKHLHDVACYDDDGSVTFRELNEASNKIALALLQQLNYFDHVSSNQGELKCVGIFMEPNYDRLVTITALLKLNIPYVPLDPVIPFKRLKLILRETNPMCIVSSTALYDQLMTVEMLVEGHDIFKYSHLYSISNHLDRENIHIPSEKRFSSGISDPLFCVLYTSGSTGTPKGVRLRHSNVINRLNWQWNEVPFKTDDVGCAKTSLLFVDSITEMFGSLLKGVPIVIVPKSVIQNPEKFISVLQKYRVTHLILVPSLLRAIFTMIKMNNSSDQLSALRYVVSSGEALPVELARQFFDVFPTDVTLANYYGSTEITGDVTFQRMKCLYDVVKSTVDDRLSIGRPVDNCNIYIVDDNLTLTTGTGQLLVSGLNVADGYVDKENITKNFLPNHLNDERGHEYLYLTGDFARVVNNMVVYEGRTDSQVKIRGHRVNMAEVERVVSSCRGVEKVVVVLCTLGDGNEVIVAFYTTPDGVSEDVINEACKKSLPGYMLPEIMLIPEFPLQAATGKIDRVELKHIYSSAKNPKCENFEFLDKTTDDIMTAVTEVLGIPKSKLNVDVNFFDVGGSSINAISVLVKIKSMGYSADVASFISASTINDFVKSLKSAYQVESPGQENTTDYVIVPLTEVIEKKEEIIKNLADTFLKKEAVVRAMGIRFAELEIFLLSFWDHFLRSGASCVCLDGKGSVIGVSAVITGESPSDIQSDGINTILNYLEYVESHSADRITDNFADSLMVMASPDLSAQEKIQVMYRLEQTSIQMAEKKGYDGMITCNTSQLTADLAHGYLGYETVGRFTIRDYVSCDEMQPFASAPKDAVLVLQIKLFNRSELVSQH